MPSTVIKCPAGFFQDDPTSTDALGDVLGAIQGAFASAQAAAQSAAEAEAAASIMLSVLSFGADPTGQNDSSAAVNAALATGNSIYVPTGTYLLNHQIIVGVNGNTAQCLRGDGKSSVFLINQNFDPTASSVVLMNGSEQNAVTITDLRFVCAQGANVNDRSTFLTLAEGGNLTTGIKYPPVILWGNGCNRFRLERLRITNCWDGIQQVHNSSSGGWWIRDIEMSCYNIGLLVSTTLDFTHLHGWHHWVFDISVPNRTVFGDGQTICMQLGQGDDLVQSLNISEVDCFEGQIIINTPTGDVMLSNMMMDGSNAGINHVNSYWTQIDEIYFTAANSPTPLSSQINMQAGRCFVSNVFGWSPISMVNMAGGELYIHSGQMQNTIAGQPVITQTAGLLQISDMDFLVNAPSGTPFSSGIVNVVGGRIMFRDNSIGTAPASGNDVVGALLIATDRSQNYVAGNEWFGWSWNPPAAPIDGFYGANSDGLACSGGFRDSLYMGSASHPTGLNFRMMTTAGQQQYTIYETDGINRWAFGMRPSADMVMLRYDNTGTLQPSPTTFYQDGTTQLCRQGLVVNWDIDYPNMQPNFSGTPAVASESNSANPIWQLTSSATAVTTTIVQRHSRGPSVDSGGSSVPAAVQTGDVLGNLAFVGYDGTAWTTNGALIQAKVASNWSGTAHPTTLNFYTSPLLSNVLAMQIDPNGNVLLPTLPATTSYANDSAAATGGVAVGQLYRNGSVVQVRVT
jgi:hypothetical protein